MENNLPIMPVENFKKVVNSLDSEKYMKFIENINGKDRLYGLDKKDRIHYISELYKYFDIKADSIYSFLVSYYYRIRLIDNFKGLSFGIVLSEKNESAYIYSDIPSDNNYGVSREAFNKLSREDKLLWMLKNCTFIPLMIEYEEIDFPNGDTSYKYSHIIRNDSIRRYILADYLGQVDCTPNPNAYYFIRKNANGYYLARDKNKEAEAKNRFGK